MGVIVGSLARQNWHRDVRRRGLEGAAAFDYVLDKTAAIGREYGFSPMGIDFGVRSLPSTDRSYLDELKSRLADAGLMPMVGFGALAVGNDEEVRRASIEEAKRNLELVATFGVRTSNFSCSLHGRTTRRGHVLLATEMLREVGECARGYGIRVCQENYNTFRSGELIQICAGSGLDNVGIQTDTGNWLILGEDPEAATRVCVPYTMHAHVRDYVFERETYNGVAVGDGLVDFEQVLPLLAEAGRSEDIIWSVEVDTDDRDEDECAGRSYDYLRDWLVKRKLNEHLGAPDPSPVR